MLDTIFTLGQLLSIAGIAYGGLLAWRQNHPAAPSRLGSALIGLDRAAFLTGRAVRLARLARTDLERAVQAGPDSMISARA